MSYTAFEACLVPKRRRCSAADLATLLALAAHVNQKDAERGWPWLAWPSQTLLAEELGLSDRQLRRKLTSLKDAGDIRETGEHKGRGIRVYEITLRSESEASTLVTSDRGEEDRSDVTALDASDTGQIRPVDRTVLTTTPDISGPDPGQMCPTEPGEPEQEPEMKPEVARADAPATAVPSLTSGTPAQQQALEEDERDLEILEQQHREKPKDRTLRGIVDLREHLGLPPLQQATEVAA